MIPRGIPPAPSRLLASALFAMTALCACKDKQPPAPPQAPKPVIRKAEPTLTLEQASAALLALPEVKAWSQDIEKRSRGQVHGAIIEDDQEPRTINGRKYWALSFVENGKEIMHRRESFLVAQSGGDILVEDLPNATVVTLGEWRRGIRRVETKSAD